MKIVKTLVLLTTLALFSSIASNANAIGLPKLGKKCGDHKILSHEWNKCLLGLQGSEHDKSDEVTSTTSTGSDTKKKKKSTMFSFKSKACKQDSGSDACMKKKEYGSFLKKLKTMGGTTVGGAD